MLPPVKFAVGAAVLALATAYLAYLGASTSWRYYVHVDECAQSPETFLDHRLRVSGRVGAGTLDVRPDRSLATFSLRGMNSELPVSCRGPLPDNLAEDMEVVVEGKLQPNGQLTGDRVLTRCASKYQAETENPAPLSGRF